MNQAKHYTCRTNGCAMAGVELPEPAAVQFDLRCQLCKSALELVDLLPPKSRPAVHWPLGLDPADMPTCLAHPWQAYCEESHPRVKLHWLIDTAEVVVRWGVAVALAEVLYAGSGVLSAAVTERIRDHIERPTLGQMCLWL